MSTHNLQKIFDPKSIAVVGASDEKEKVGGIVLRNLLSAEFAGSIYPVNVHRDKVQGLRAYRNVGELPQPVDLAVVCTPAATVPDLVCECGQSGIHGVIILSAGFGEIGPAGHELEAQVRQAASKFEGLRILGPNCLGAIVPAAKLNVSFAAGMPKPGRIAFLSQSGALCTAMLDWARERDIGFSYFVSIGNAMDVSIADLLDFLVVDPHTSAMMLYVESIVWSRPFMSAARAFSRSKPIVAYKAGRFPESAQAAASHTGAMASVDSVYSAAFERAGVVRVFDLEGLYDCAELLSYGRRPRNDRLAIVTNAGGPGVIAADELIARGGKLATLSPETLDRLNGLLPPPWSHTNPVDVLGDAPPERFDTALEAVLADQQVDAVLAIVTPQAMSDPTGTAHHVRQVAAATSKPILASWMGGAAMHEARTIFDRAGIPNYATPGPAVRAFLDLYHYARLQEILSETPRDIPLSFELDREHLRAVWQPKLCSGEHLSEADAKSLLADYGIPVSMPHPAVSPAEAVELARQIGYPVVLKIHAPDISHKTDVGGVALNLTTDAEVLNAYEQILKTVRSRRPLARIEGLTVQRMVALLHGLELILGAKKDPVFGPVVMLGLGGIATEVFQDRAFGLPPLNERLARRMLESLRCWPLLRGYRGQQGADIDGLVELLLRFSCLVADYPEISEIEANPLLASAAGTVVLDARVIVDRQACTQELRRYGHLAIQPYPSEFTWPAQLRCGTSIVLRPLKPEDEPMWLELIRACSDESIWGRFRGLIRSATHEMATRFCYVDYDRELPIAAEATVDGRTQLLGVMRLVSDAEHESAEYAILIADHWQGKGLGSLLTEYALQIGRRWQLRRLSAVTTCDNFRMLHLFRKFGFELKFWDRSNEVTAHKVW